MHLVDGIEILARALIVDTGDYSIGVAPMSLQTSGITMVLDVSPTEMSAHDGWRGTKEMEWNEKSNLTERNYEMNDDMEIVTFIVIRDR